jgi:branched-chain amino acid transport system substrate-binding protein
MKRVAIAASVLGLILSMSACSSSGSGNGSGGGDNPSQVALPTPSAAANGKPIKVFYYNEEGASAVASSPESYQAAQAATSYINKNLGGVKGRPLQLTHCASLGTPDSVTNCANKAVDAKPDVVVKGVEVASASAIPIIAGAGIPYVTLNAGTPQELSNPDSFVLSAGFAAQFAPIPAFAKEKGYKSVGVIYTNVTSLSTALDGTVSKVFKKEGVKYVSVPVEISTADLTPAYSALLAKHVDAVLVVTSAAQCAATLKARASLADNHPLMMSSSCNVSSVLKTVSPTVTKGMTLALLDTSAVSDDKDTQVYHAAMKKYQPSADVGSFAPTGFSSIMDLYRTLITIDDPATINTSTIKSTLQTAKNVPLFMGGGKTFSCGEKLFPTSPSVCTGWAFLVSYDSGTYKLENAYDAAKLLSGS